MPKSKKHSQNMNQSIPVDKIGNEKFRKRLMDVLSRGIFIIDSKGECIYADSSSLRELSDEESNKLIGKNLKQLAEFARFPEMNPGPVLQIDLTGKILTSNSAARDIFGSNLQSLYWQEICPHLDKNTWSHILKASEPVPIERVIGKQTFIFSHRSDKNNDQVFVFGADISEKKKTEKALRETDELVHLLLNSTMEGIYGIDRDGNCTFANVACVKLLGFKSLKELHGNQMHRLVHRTGPDGEICTFEESRIYKAMLRKEGVYVNDETMFRKDNSDFPVEYWSYPVKQDGKLIGCVITFMDATNRRQAEKLQSDYTSALAEIARFPEMNPGPVLRLDITGKILMANKAAHSVFKNPVNQFWKNICPDIDVQVWKKIIKTKTIVLERHIGNQDFIFTHRRDFEGDAVFVFGANITQQKKIEWALQQKEKMASLGKLSAGLAHELNNPAAAAGRAGDRLKETIDALQLAIIELTKCNIDQDLWILFTNQVNEFRNRSSQQDDLSPIERCDLEENLQDWLEKRGIGNSWEIASTLLKFYVEKNDLDKISSRLSPDTLPVAVTWLYRVLTAYELAGNIINSTHNISNLVNVVKSYSHMGSAPERFVDIHTGIEDTITILAHKLKEGTEIIRRYDQNLPKIRIKGSELNQVWTNIIDNALFAIGGKGKIIVKTFRQKNWMVVQIEDTGPGIPMDIQSKIFDPFFTTKAPGKGTGMGLNISHHIITHLHEGKLSVNSVPGATCFEVKLPLAKSLLARI